MFTRFGIDRPELAADATPRHVADLCVVCVVLDAADRTDCIVLCHELSIHLGPTLGVTLGGLPFSYTLQLAVWGVKKKSQQKFSQAGRRYILLLLESPCDRSRYGQNLG